MDLSRDILMRSFMAYRKTQSQLAKICVLCADFGRVPNGAVAAIGSNEQFTADTLVRT